MADEDVIAPMALDLIARLQQVRLLVLEGAPSAALLAAIDGGGVILPMRQVKKLAAEHALEAMSGNEAKAARALRVTPATLRRILD